jgi:hypothetical protein
MTRYLFVFALAFILGGTSYALRPVADAAEPSPPPRHESMAEVIGAVVEACVRSGGTWVNGVEDGIVLGRCYPLPSAGVVKVAGVRR